MTIDTARLAALKASEMTATSVTPTRMNVFIADGNKYVLVGKITGTRVDNTHRLRDGQAHRDGTLMAHDIVRLADGTQITSVKVVVNSFEEGLDRIKGWAVMTLINTPQQGDSK